ncbi:ATP-grasp domain-containing protein [Ureibacillus sp. NPDC094379]
MGTNKSGSSREGINAAKNLGFKINVLTANEKLLEEKEEFQEVDNFYFVDLNNLEQVMETVKNIQKKEQVACIISFIDSYVYLAAKLSNELCGTKLSVEAIKIMEDKLLTRKQLQGKHYSPFFYVLSKDQSINSFIKKVKKNLPLIVKLPKSCGSKDVYLAQSESELKKLLLFLRKNFDSEILLEEYLDGPQVIVEAIVHEGEVQIAAIVEQEITKKEKFIVTGYSISQELSKSFISSLLIAAKDIIRDLGLENGNCHLEIRRKRRKWKLIEANPRISGGMMNDFIKEAYGFNYAEQIIKVYLDQSPILTKTKEVTVYAHYLTVNRTGKLDKVSGKQMAKKKNGVLKVFIKPRKGKILTPPLSMGNRYGYVIAKGKTKAESRKIAQLAARYIKFHLVPIK